MLHVGEDTTMSRDDRVKDVQEEEEGTFSSTTQDESNSSSNRHLVTESEVYSAMRVATSPKPKKKKEKRVDPAQKEESGIGGKISTKKTSSSKTRNKKAIPAQKQEIGAVMVGESAHETKKRRKKTNTKENITGTIHSEPGMSEPGVASREVKDRSKTEVPSKKKITTEETQKPTTLSRTDMDEPGVVPSQVQGRKITEEQSKKKKKKKKNMGIKDNAEGMGTKEPAVVPSEVNDMSTAEGLAKKSRLRELDKGSAMDGQDKKKKKKASQSNKIKKKSLDEETKTAAKQVLTSVDGSPKEASQALHLSEGTRTQRSGVDMTLNLPVAQAVEVVSPFSPTAPRTVCAPSPAFGQPLGVTIRKINRRLYLSEIKPDSAFRDRGLRVGDQVLSINGTDCFDLSVSRAVELLRKVDQPKTCMTVQPLPASIISTEFHNNATTTFSLKKDPNKANGLDFSQVNGQVYISSIEPYGAFGGIGLLRAGNRVVSINDHTPASCQDARWLVTTSDSQISLTVQEMQSVPTAVTKSMPTNATVPQHDHTSCVAPPGAPDGGVWGTGKRFGDTSGTIVGVGIVTSLVGWIFLGGPSLVGVGCILGPCCCPCDGGHYYKANGRFYDENGASVDVRNFKPD